MEKEKSVIEDLHGNVFERSLKNFSIIGSDPFNCPTLFDEKEERIFNKDLISNVSFILIRYKGNYGYILTVNNLYIYGKLKHIGYKPSNDIRR